ncbi:6-hydroxynicotinate 3-monooxygenase-like protein [Hapsidospora chrysogenum ATCC 11550]|uniref:6-hydroxynicotinate 3-monooxygenase-like protein n=1 Tax=Hapsidospora chrysogenum (strain ATCC 11550 / CBS 779.69 / DSM 880 / IAM 14645 / JCM 23072 / IMI 49137) TaxID=857340 RepID=A0A086T413_HAPC1|nr:6-hydroxynicotinate 3-monooxygenase-like protein [Hapsidospora chrysogenum ATCC 11550]
MSITIYEAHDTNEDTTAEQRQQHSSPTHSSTLLVGGGLAVGPNGLGVLQRLDESLLRDVALHGYVTSHSNFKDKNGNLLMRIEASGTGISATDSYTASHNIKNCVACSRHLLWRCLRSRIPDEHIVHKRVLEVIAEPQGRRNVVRFADGSDSIDADLVIGADGVRSTVKMALFPEHDEDPYPPQYEYVEHRILSKRTPISTAMSLFNAVFRGLVGIGGFVPAADLKDYVEKGSMNFIFGGNGFFGYFFSSSSISSPHRDSLLHVSEPGESLAWWSTYQIKHCPDRSALDLGDVVRQLRERHSHWKDPVVQRILGAARVQNMYPTWTLPPLPTWERDGVVLLGDAAHALPPTSGQGASQALEDSEAFALLLAHHLAATEGKDSGERQATLNRAINTAARQYSTLRRPRVTEILQAARKMQNSKRDMGVILEYIMYILMRIVGLFPNFAAQSMRKVTEYNVAQEVSRLLAAESQA